MHDMLLSIMLQKRIKAAESESKLINVDKCLFREIYNEHHCIHDLLPPLCASINYSLAIHLTT